MPEIIINTKSVVVEPTDFNEPLSSLIDRAKAETPFKNSDISDWEVVSGMNPNKEIDLTKRYQFSYGQIFANPPFGTGA